MKTVLYLVLLLLVFGSVCCSRQQRATLQQVKHYPHEHLQASAFEPLDKLKTVEYKLREGESLASLARLRYGHQKYYSVIKLYNHIEDETQVAANQTLRLPDVSDILAEEGLTKVVPQEVNLILCSRAQLEECMGQMWGLTEHLDSYGYDIDMVQQRFALALTYAIIWARDGFK